MPAMTRRSPEIGDWPLDTEDETVVEVDPAFRSHRKFGGKRMNKVPRPHDVQQTGMMFERSQGSVPLAGGQP
ncbi:hypothetical protein [Paraburkholderia sp. MM5477-R1]|uniref:hypothetical protein n=1 Tax=Paraburkholderia sp. MM5477-R1 TaxID=2991062 RepID=UPI003D1DE0DE